MSNKLTNTIRRSKEDIINIKPRRSKSKKKNMGLGIQPGSLEGCNYTLSNNDTEVVKLDFKHLDTGIIETFNFINGSSSLDRVMDVLDPTGEVDIDFKDYIGTKMNVEIVESGKFRNIINAWALVEEHEEEIEEETNEVYHDNEDEDNDYDEVENAVYELLSDDYEEEQ